MESIRTRVESWIRDQTARIRIPWPPAPPSPLPQWSWPPWKGGNGRREREQRLREEYERQRRQLEDLCRCIKVDSIADLQEILCSMVLSECVYKSPANEMIRAINKFKSDFGGQVVSLERVQPSLDHVPHRYLLAESGDTLFASFIGTKQYKDVITDVNIFQGAIFNEDNAEELDLVDTESDPDDKQKKTEENIGNSLLATQKNLKRNLKPAAHSGFLARAKGIPALELYRLAQKKNRKLVLCGHSLGGAVAALATLAILRILASSSFPREHEKVQIKCITFSQPPVGNAALRDYVHQKGWKHYFKTYCIPEDLVPRILSPAYFHHYNAQTQLASTDPKLSDLHSVKHGEGLKGSDLIKSKDIDGEQLVLGLGPVQTSLWRLLKLVPLDGIRKHLNTLKRTRSRLGDVSWIANRVLQSRIDESEAEPESLVIQEGSDGISLTPLPVTYKGTVEGNGNIIDGKNGKEGGISKRWRRVPYLPSYIPFGQLYLLGSSSVESLSGAEYSKLTSVKSVITELRERFQSHSMKSYRSRFQKMYDTCMCINVSPFLGIDQLPQFPHLPQWLGLTTAGAVELGHIVESPVIKTATSIIPLGWNGLPGEKNTEPLKVDVVGHGLHLCTLVQAQVNGIWCSTSVETLPSMPPYSSNYQIQPNLQKLRILVGAPLKRPPKPFVNEGPLHPMIHSSITECVSSTPCYNSGSFCGEDNTSMGGLNGFVIYCINDFITVSKKVYFRARRVRFLGLEGAGKTSLFNAILDQGRKHGDASFDSLHPEMDTREGVAGGLCYLDCEGVKLQQLHTECSNFKEEVQMGVHDLSKKIDLIVLVHNLSQKIPLYHPSNTSQPQPALWLLLNEALALGTPWVLAITNKFSVGAHQQKALIDSSMNAYRATPDITEVINSRPFLMSTSTCQLSSIEEAGQQNSFLLPFNLARMSFQKKTMVLPVEGVTTFRQLVHRVLQNHEEMAFQELANERLSLELARERDDAIKAQRDFQGNQSSITAAAVGASLGAGLGLVMAIVMGAASALRKP